MPLRVPGVRIPSSPQNKKLSFLFAIIKLLYICKPFSGYSVARLSRLLWEQEVAGSNPATPTLFSTKIDDFWSNLLITNFPTKNFKIISKDNFLALFNRCRLQKKSKTEQKTEQKNICGIFNFKNAKLLHVYFVLLKKRWCLLLIIKLIPDSWSFFSF